ncbi:MAG: hypothetical protein Q4P12_06715, partial [Bacteroidales bacterium]|nr:hypothetical protein [Bacteroidales bacterium]
YHAKVISGNAKPFSISSSSAGNWVTFGVSEFSDVVVNETESISVFTINDYDGKTAIISCPEAGEYTTVFVDYEGNILNKAKIVAQKFSSGVNYVNKPKDIEMSAGDKIFLWKDMKSIQPLCEAYTVK